MVALIRFFARAVSVPDCEKSAGAAEGELYFGGCVGLQAALCIDCFHRDEGEVLTVGVQDIAISRQAESYRVAHGLQNTGGDFPIAIHSRRLERAGRVRAR